jgi:predicted HicB family RNase H-like nuclease
MPRTQLNIRLIPADLERWKHEAALLKLSLTEWITRACNREVMRGEWEREKKSR